MKNNELLQSGEKIKPVGKKTSANKVFLSQEKICEIFTQRKNNLEKIKSFICLNFFHSIEEKIHEEERSLSEILNHEANRKEVLKKYSFVLNPQYFEQKFFKKTY